VKRERGSRNFKLISGLMPPKFSADCRLIHKPVQLRTSRNCRLACSPNAWVESRIQETLSRLPFHVCRLVRRSLGEGGLRNLV